MAVIYTYAHNEFNTEQEAQDYVLTIKNQLDNEPTNWIVVKEITGSEDAGWTVLPYTFTDSEILSGLDSSKTYQGYGPLTGINEFPLTADEIADRVTKGRKAWAQYFNVTYMERADVSTTPATITTVTLNEDMSSYVA